MIRKGINTSGRKSCLVQRHKKWKEHLSRGTDDASSRYLDKQNDAAEYRKRVKEQLRAADTGGECDEEEAGLDKEDYSAGVKGNDDGIPADATVFSATVIGDNAVVHIGSCSGLSPEDCPVSTNDFDDGDMDTDNGTNAMTVPEWKRHKLFLAGLFSDGIVCVRHNGEELFKNKSSMQAYQRRKVTTEEWESNGRMLHAFRISREEEK
jgi:hypothetical protein